MNESINTIFESEIPILNEIQDTLSVVAQNTYPYEFFGQNVIGWNLLIAVLTGIASFAAAFFSFKDWRTQNRTAEAVDKQNIRNIDFLSQAKHMYRTEVYALAMEVKHRERLSDNTLYLPQETYFEKTKPLEDIVPVQSFVNNSKALEAVNDLLVQMRMVCLEHDDATSKIKEIRYNDISEQQYTEQFELIFSNMSFKPFHIIHQMMIVAKKMRMSGVGCNLDEHSLAIGILEKHNGFVKEYAKDVWNLTKEQVNSISIDFQHMERACEKFDQRNPHYTVRLAEIDNADIASSKTYNHLREILNNREYDNLFSDIGASLWKVLPLFYTVEVLCELANGRMKFYTKQFVN